MKNRDIIQQKFLEAYNKALADGDGEAMAKAFWQLSQEIAETVKEEANKMLAEKDSEVLAQRGQRILTSEEVEFYNNVIAGIKNDGSVSNPEISLPQSIVLSIYENLKKTSEVLSIVDFQNIGISTKWIFNKGTESEALWGKISTEITKELETGLTAIDISLKKLSAFMLVPNDIVELGATWLDEFVRTFLHSQLEMALEKAVISGDGKDKPIGMVRDVAENVSISGGIYPKKNAVKITDFSPAEYGKAVANLAKNEKGHDINVQNLVLIVNSTDYYEKIMPATTIKTQVGYINNVLPLPTRIITSPYVNKGEAILGMEKAYKLGSGTGATKGKLEASSEYKFLEDFTTYKIKILADGRAKDANSFVLLDVSKVTPDPLLVKNVGTGA